MKVTTGMVGMVLVACLNAANAVTDIVPAKWKAPILAVSLVGGALLQSLAHFSNPDGTSAKLPTGLTPEQLEQYRKEFLVGK